MVTHQFIFIHGSLLHQAKQGTLLTLTSPSRPIHEYQKQDQIQAAANTHWKLCV